MASILDNVVFVIASGAKQSPSTLGDCFGANSAPRNDTLFDKREVKPNSSNPTVHSPVVTLDLPLASPASKGGLPSSRPIAKEASQS